MQSNVLNSVYAGVSKIKKNKADLLLKGHNIVSDKNTFIWKLVWVKASAKYTEVNN